MLLDGKVCLISGAASGIGRATALRFLAEGAVVVGADINAEGLAELPDEVETTSLDVTDPASCEAAIETTATAGGGRLDVLVNCAGVLAFEESRAVTPESFRRIIDINLTGTFLMCQAALRRMVPQGSGVLLNLASASAHLGTPWAAAYSASKGGIVAMTRSLAVEYGRQGIRCCGVSPNGVITPLISAFQPPEGADLSLMDRTMPFDGLFEPEEIAGPLAFLASDVADRINGEILHVTDAVTS